MLSLTDLVDMSIFDTASRAVFDPAP